MISIIYQEIKQVHRVQLQAMQKNQPNDSAIEYALLGLDFEDASDWEAAQLNYALSKHPIAQLRHDILEKMQQFLNSSASGIIPPPSIIENKSAFSTTNASNHPNNKQKMKKRKKETNNTSYRLTLDDAKKLKAIIDYSHASTKNEVTLREVADYLNIPRLAFREFVMSTLVRFKLIIWNILEKPQLTPEGKYELSQARNTENNNHQAASPAVLSPVPRLMRFTTTTSEQRHQLSEQQTTTHSLTPEEIETIRDKMHINKILNP